MGEVDPFERWTLIDRLAALIELRTWGPEHQEEFLQQKGLTVERLEAWRVEIKARFDEGRKRKRRGR